MPAWAGLGMRYVGKIIDQLTKLTNNENQYPGAACDIPSHSYQFSFNPKPDWTAMYAPSWEIRNYLTGSASKYGADRFIKLEHKVIGCTWNQQDGKWHVKIEKPNGEVFEDI